MWRARKPKRRNVLLAAALVVVLCGGAAILYATSRSSPNLVAEAKVRCAHDMGGACLE
jgi:hypothetical protein